MNQAQGLSVTPNPAKVSGKVTIRGRKNQVVFVAHKGSIQRVQLDDNGRATADVPGEPGDHFTVSDMNFPRPASIRVQVVSTQR